jgi:hypothetical protein
MHEMLGYSTIKIGRALGDRDHSTVIHALNRVKDVIDNGTDEIHPEDIKREIDEVGELAFYFEKNAATVAPERDVEAECRAW